MAGFILEAFSRQAPNMNKHSNIKITFICIVLKTQDAEAALANT
jgi:hypothetical protein